MDYVTPGPSVNQVLTGVAATLGESSLLPCIVGSLVQVEKLSPITPALPVSTLTTQIYPLLKPGAIVNNSSVEIDVANATLAIVTGTDASGDALSNSITTVLGSFSSVVNGDNLNVLIAPNQYHLFTVDHVSVDGKTAFVTSPLFMTLAAVAFKVTRSVVGTIKATIGTPIYNASSIQFNSLKYKTFDIASGNVTISYKAQRRDMNGFYSVTDLTQLMLDMDVVPENPLGFYLGKIMAAASGEQTSLAYIIPDNSEISYLAALEVLSTNPNIYMITQAPSGSTVTDAAVSLDIAENVKENSKSTPGPSFYRSGIVPLTDEASFLSKTLISNASFTKA